MRVSLWINRFCGLHLKKSEIKVFGWQYFPHREGEKFSFFFSFFFNFSSVDWMKVTSNIQYNDDIIDDGVFECVRRRWFVDY